MKNNHVGFGWSIVKHMTLFDIEKWSLKPGIRLCLSEDDAFLRHLRRFFLKKFDVSRILMFVRCARIDFQSFGNAIWQAKAEIIYNQKASEVKLKWSRCWGKAGRF